MVLDTSTIYKDFTLTRPETVRMPTEARHPTFHLCLPMIVVREMVNHFREDLEEANRRLTAALQGVDRLLGRQTGIPLTSSQMAAEVNAFQGRFAALLNRYDVHVEDVPTSLAGVEFLVERDLRRRKPFSDQRRTGRDEGAMRDRGGMRAARPFKWTYQGTLLAA